MGKYLTNFKTKEEYEDFKASGEYLTPNVSFIETAGSVINDSYQIQGGTASTMEYLDVRNIDEDLKFSLINSSYLIKIPAEGNNFIYPTLFAANDFYNILYVDTVAIAIDFSASVAFNNETLTIKEMISCDNGYPLDVFDSIPRITKEEFYNLDNGGGE